MHLRKDPDGFQSGQYEGVEELLRPGENKTPYKALFKKKSAFKKVPLN